MTPLRVGGLVIVAVAVAVVVASGQVGTGLVTPPTPSPTPAASPSDPSTFAALPGTDTQRRAGVDAAGARYRVEVPSDWNGELVLYAHGYRGPGGDLEVTDPPIRAFLVGSGYAWAASSFRTNGYAAEEGVEDTHALLAAFPARTGRPAPTRTYLYGESLGGHVAVAALERYPDTYAGALPVCGVLADVGLFDYLQDAALLAHAIAEVAAAVPAPVDFRARTGPLIEQRLGLEGRLTGDGERYRAALEQLSGGARPLYAEGFDFWHGPLTAVEGTPFLLGVWSGAISGGTADPQISAAVGNDDRSYALDADPEVSAEEADLNAAVLRQAREPGAVPPFPVVAGRPGVPVLSLHVLGDLFVPFDMAQRYAAEVEANGQAALLVTRAIRDVRHCGVSAQEVAAGFQDLVAWVAGGPPPAGDPILDPAAVATEDFGCAFSIETRPFLPTCPGPGRATLSPS